MIHPGVSQACADDSWGSPRPTSSGARLVAEGSSPREEPISPKLRGELQRVQSMLTWFSDRQSSIGSSLLPDAKSATVRIANGLTPSMSEELRALTVPFEVLGTVALYYVDVLSDLLLLASFLRVDSWLRSQNISNEKYVVN